ncbi:MAG: asparagine synthase (glutamine-hydrolyzing) [Magnetovibrio sp.]|nr:asparagine synthase (glutamine-hydrolyzing) [Magnetovibrio sp.]
MCGIAGSIGAVLPAPARRAKALQAMRLRGPDARGEFCATYQNAQVSLLHTRLSIIDLDPRANQPFQRDNLTLVYNGELYNYVELRDELVLRGHTFTTQSDTEVVLEGYRAWGLDCFDRFEGMWALAILDPARGLVLSRDRFGEKPLYTQQVEGTLYFASDITALAALSGRKPELDQQSIMRFLVNGYKAVHKKSRTFYKDVGVFPNASTAVLHDGSTPQARAYWQLNYTPVEMSMNEALDGTRERLDRAVRTRLRADVPVAFCLSGGVDSTALASIAAKRFDQELHCFSIIDGDPRYNESANIEAVVQDLGCETFKVQTSTDGFFERLDDLVAYRRQPVLTISYYVHSFLSQSIHDQGYKIAISGTAADEIFTGYYDHYSMWLAQMSASTSEAEFQTLVEDWRQSYGAVVRNPYLQDPLAFAQNPNQREHIFLNQDVFEDLLTQPFHEDFAETPYSENLLRNRMMNELFHESIPVLLAEDDANSMRWSVENRSPYLDRELVEFLYTVPARHLIHDGYAKWLLRAASQGALTDQVRLDRTKKGFNASILSLVDVKDPATRERLLSDSAIFDVVDKDKFSKLLDREEWPNSLSKFLFSFVSCRALYDQYDHWQV